MLHAVSCWRPPLPSILLPRAHVSSYLRHAYVIRADDMKAYYEECVPGEMQSEKFMSKRNLR